MLWAARLFGAVLAVAFIARISQRCCQFLRRRTRERVTSLQGERQLCHDQELNKKLAAAKERDKIDVERAALTVKDVRTTRSLIHSQITALVKDLGVFGVKVDGKGRDVVPHPTS